MNTTNQTTPVAAATPAKRGMFILPDGRKVLFTFCLVSSLFLLWGFCNGMIDVMDKHFQEVLGLSLSHTHRTIHLTGPESALNGVARATLGVSLVDIQAGLKSQ